ncbi:hypothetical protein AhaeAN59_01075 [Acinetobacter haemolyticus]|uniref:Uncharacterized protein n=1 Tax=Acinetobacter haemolyticus TaxID=29430 RepID=A0A857IG55_ACIHA|nr:hypothetical protein AhaeAN59_01075 [Acinetobacter haemolyticus]QHI12079.1 hypothetical protein AhaeAN43_01070 [Acinetobacter haemolyticus]
MVKFDCSFAKVNSLFHSEGDRQRNHHNQFITKRYDKFVHNFRVLFYNGLVMIVYDDCWENCC